MRKSKRKNSKEKKDGSTERFFFTASSHTARYIHFESKKLGLKPSEFIRMQVHKAMTESYLHAGE